MNEQAAVPNQAIPGKSLKSASKELPDLLRRRLASGLLRNLLPTLRNMFNTLLMRFWLVEVYISHSQCGEAEGSNRR